MGQKEQDAAREEWFANIDNRLKERREREKKQREMDKLRREWWGVPAPPEETEEEGRSGEGKES